MDRLKLSFTTYARQTPKVVPDDTLGELRIELNSGEILIYAALNCETSGTSFIGHMIIDGLGTGLDLNVQIANGLAGVFSMSNSSGSVQRAIPIAKHLYYIVPEGGKSALEGSVYHKQGTDVRVEMNATIIRRTVLSN